MKTINQNTRFTEAQNTLAELTGAFNAATAEEARLLGLLAAPADTFDPLAADLAEKNAQLEQQRDALAIDASAFKRIADVDGLCCISEAAKALQMGPQELFRRLSAERWIFRHTRHSNWSAYQRVIDAGLMAHKLVSAANGQQFSQAMLTVKGMARLAQMLEERVAQ